MTTPEELDKVIVERLQAEDFAQPPASVLSRVVMWVCIIIALFFILNLFVGVNHG